MTLLSVLDILLMIVGGAGMIYQGLCIVMSLFAKPVRFPDAPMTNRYAVLISAMWWNATILSWLARDMR